MLAKACIIVAFESRLVHEVFEISSDQKIVIGDPNYPIAPHLLHATFPHDFLLLAKFSPQERDFFALIQSLGSNSVHRNGICSNEIDSVATNREYLHI